MNLLNSISKSKRPPIYYIGSGFIILLVSYTLWLFFYLKIVGVLAVAVIKDGIPTSEGVDVRYEFLYNGVSYTGGFTAGNYYEIGGKYFVLFSRDDPDKNLLQYAEPVPYCFKDSLNSFWTTIPKCTP